MLLSFNLYLIFMNENEVEFKVSSLALCVPCDEYHASRTWAL